MSTRQLVIIGLLGTFSSTGWACLSAEPEPHQLDEEEILLDDEAPAAVADLAPSLYRGQLLNTSCDDISTLSLDFLPAVDDRTPAAELGYRLVLLDGELPEGMSLPDGAIRAETGHISVAWLDGLAEEQELIDFSLGLIAVDLAGNESELATVDVFDAGSGLAQDEAPAGCSTLSAAPARAAVLALLALALTSRRSRDPLHRARPATRPIPAG